MQKKKQKAGLLFITLVTLISFCLSSAGVTYAATLTPTQDLALAQAAMAAVGVINPVEAVDTNVTRMAQSIVNEAVSGVTVLTKTTYNTQIASDGRITYGSSEVKGQVTFRLSKSEAASITQQLKVVVPASDSTPIQIPNPTPVPETTPTPVPEPTPVLETTPTPVPEPTSVPETKPTPVPEPAVKLTPTQDLALAQAAMAVAGVMNPVEGVDNNITPMAQSIVNEAVSGVTVLTKTTYNTQIASDGRITYGSSEVSGNVTFRLSKSGASSITQQLMVVVRASDSALIPIPKLNVAPDVVDDSATVNQNSMANEIAVLANDSDPDGGIIKVSAVTQGTNGSVTCTATGISYTPKANFTGSDSFTYTITDGVLTDTAAVAVKVSPVTTTPSGAYNVKNYGAKGDGVTDDTAAINAAVTAVNAAGGGTVFIPAGTYKIVASASSGAGINMKSNVILNMDSATFLKLANNTYAKSYVILCNNISSATVTGGNIIGDRNSSTEQYGLNHCAGIGIMNGCSYIHVSNINISYCRGDGIYQGVNNVANFNSYTYFDRVNTSHNARMGLTYISVKHSWVTNFTADSIGGLANAGCGIDFEPNSTASWLQDIHLDNVVCTNCDMNGFKTSFAKYAATPNPVDITVTNYTGTFNSWLKYGISNHGIVVKINGTTYTN